MKHGKRELRSKRPVYFIAACIIWVGVVSGIVAGLYTRDPSRFDGVFSPPSVGATELTLTESDQPPEAGQTPTAGTSAFTGVLPAPESSDDAVESVPLRTDYSVPDSAPSSTEVADAAGSAPVSTEATDAASSAPVSTDATDAAGSAPVSTEAVDPAATDLPTELPHTVVMFNATKGLLTAEGEEDLEATQGYVYATAETGVYADVSLEGEPLYLLDAKETAIVKATYYTESVSGEDLVSLLETGASFLTATKPLASVYQVEANGQQGYIDASQTAVVDGLFVLVDISEQHLWLIDGNQVVMDTDVVTGRANKWDTRKGIFQIQRKAVKQTLMQNSKVDYWMPFDGGIGLHDASWRTTFGGTYYLKSGSHGCVNIPPSRTQEIYDAVSVGTTVIVQK